MSLFLVRNRDGSVRVTVRLPEAVTLKGETFAVHRISTPDDDETRRLIWMKDEDSLFPMKVDLRDLLEGSVANVTLHYRDMEGIIAAWSDKEEVVSWRPITLADIPEDRAFRNAWCDVTPEPVVDIDMAKARGIHRNRLRALRTPKLAALDIDYQRADEDKDATRKRAIAARKRALRDVTADPAIEAARTPGELKAVVPAALKE